MDQIEKRILEIVEANAEKLIAFGTDIFEHPELGYMEHRTAGKFAEEIRALGMEPEEGLAVTGVKAYLKQKQEGEFRLCLMGELDGICVPGHPNADPETQAAHACGHNAQLTGVLGAAIALSDPEVRQALGGNVVFIGVPNEESGTPDDVKETLMAEGKIHYMGGKCELIHIGALDDIDMTLGHHITGDRIYHQVTNSPSQATLRKSVEIHGKASHPLMAGHAIDAQKTAMLAIQNVNAQREGLDMLWYPRRAILHSQILSGASALNVVSSDASIAFDIRGDDLAIIQELNYITSRALEGAAVVTGAGYEVTSEPGYLPIVPVKDASVLLEAFELVDPQTPVDYFGPDRFAGASDYGDLSNIMPLLQFMTGGHTGVGHTRSYAVSDPYEYYVVTAKMFAIAAYRLMKDGAARAKEIVRDNPPKMSAPEWRRVKESMGKSEARQMEPRPWFGPTIDAPNPPRSE